VVIYYSAYQLDLGDFLQSDSSDSLRGVAGL
jgi:hypothetical protein